MQIDHQAYFIVCPLVFLAGLVDAAAGGGGLISLPAYFFAGLPAHYAIATNKLSSALGTIVSTMRYCKNKYIDIPLAIPSILAAFAGSFIGARLSLLASDQLMKYILLPVLLLSAFFVLQKNSLADYTGIGISRKKVFMIVITASLVIGMYDGFYGPGTGTFLILVYNGMAKIDIRTASGNAKMVNLSSNLSALITFFFRGKIIISLGLTAALFCIAGHYIGAGLVMKNGSKAIKPVILIVLILLFLKIITD